MPTICLDCRYADRGPSGIGTIVQALAARLPALAPDWSFRFLRHSHALQPLSKATNVTEVELAIPANGPASMWFLPRFVKLDDIDLFHAPANTLAHGLAMPCVTTIHDVMWLTHSHWCRADLWGQVERRFYGHGIRRALGQSAAIITVSEASRKAITEQSEAAGQSIAVIPAGVDAMFYPRTPGTGIMAALGLPAVHFVLVVGQHAPYKNHVGALQAFAEAFRSRPDMHLVFVQRRNPTGNVLRPLAANHGLLDRVHFLETVGSEDLAALYSEADLLLHPSLCEGFGVPIAEAMACGCPVVTSDRSAMPEVAAGAALLVDPDDIADVARAMRQIVDSAEVAQDMSRKGLQRAAAFNWDEHAAQTLAVYRQVLGL